MYPIYIYITHTCTHNTQSGFLTHSHQSWRRVAGLNRMKSTCTVCSPVSVTGERDRKTSRLRERKAWLSSNTHTHTHTNQFTPVYPVCTYTSYYYIQVYTYNTLALKLHSLSMQQEEGVNSVQPSPTAIQLPTFSGSTQWWAHQLWLCIC